MLNWAMLKFVCFDQKYFLQITGIKLKAVEVISNLQEFF